MAQPYIGPNGNTQYREATGDGTLLSPYLPAFSMSSSIPSNYFVSVNVPKPATSTPYAINRVYGGVFQIQNIGSSGGFVKLESISILFNMDALPVGMSDFALYLFNATPTETFADNTGFSVPAANRASILTLGGINLSVGLSRGGGTVVAETILMNSTYKLASGSTSLWGCLVNLSEFSHNSASSFTVRVYAK